MVRDMMNKLDVGWQDNFEQRCAFDFGCAGTDKRRGSYFVHSRWFFVFQDSLLWQDTSKNCQLVGAE